LPQAREANVKSNAPPERTVRELNRVTLAATKRIRRCLVPAIGRHGIVCRCAGGEIFITDRFFTFAPPTFASNHIEPFFKLQVKADHVRPLQRTTPFFDNISQGVF
jgi:hypothetical protein